MAKRARSDNGTTTSAYRHSSQKRTNIPPAKIAAEGQVPKVARVRYHYSPHLPPELRFDQTGKADQLPHLIVEAGRRALSPREQEILAGALRTHQPWLEWAGKREQHERGFFGVEPVALHIHERVSTEAMLRVLARDDVQRDLFADPQQPYREAVQFYKHPMDWANRIILGDSLQVMTSLARREHLAGKVRMIYVDPPYGILFRSNFQPEILRRDVKEKDEDLTREAEMVRAFRDTWQLGVHSYLEYLRQRLSVARELLTDDGSVFVQIGQENSHRVRAVLDEVFGPESLVADIVMIKSSGLGSTLLPRQTDTILWYSRNPGTVRYRQIFLRKSLEGDGADAYSLLMLSDGSVRRLTEVERQDPSAIPKAARPFRYDNLTKPGPGSRYEVEVDGRSFTPGSRWWGLPEEAMRRAVRAGRVAAQTTSLAYVRFLEDFPATPLTNVWSDTATGSGLDKMFVVQTVPKVIERCMLMSTDPGDLVLDPTCGSGTTAFVAERWGRRWITIDTSRVAISIARQRLVTAQFEHYRTLGDTPLSGFAYKRVARVTLKSIAQNQALDPLLDKHEPIIASRLKALNSALSRVPSDLRKKLGQRLADKERREGKRAVTDAERRRWDLPSSGWQEWNAPYDADPEWPTSLREALIAYRAAWRARREDVDNCIAANAEMQELVDSPEVVERVVRVSGPFTVEGVRPEELSIGDDGLFDATPNEFESGREADDTSDERNVHAYLTQMLQHLRSDGVTFLNNKHRRFASLESLFEDASATVLHAEGAWDGSGPNSVAVSFGPQHGPVTALQVEEAIRAAKRYDDLVIAGFGFDAEAWAAVEEQSHPRLRIHVAQIRPDLNEAMEGLLKDTPNSQLFTVFGQPEIKVTETKEGWVCTLKGVDIYNPVENTVRSSGADKVAAWFLDSDFDGRCFCITQAFFPDQNAWDKIAKALGSSADPEAFAALKGTVSLPFSKGKYSRIAVKVIDPRGNEVMAVRRLG